MIEDLEKYKNSSIKKQKNIYSKTSKKIEMWIPQGYDLRIDAIEGQYKSILYKRGMLSKTGEQVNTLELGMYENIRQKVEEKYTLLLVHRDFFIAQIIEKIEEEPYQVPLFWGKGYSLTMAMKELEKDIYKKNRTHKIYQLGGMYERKTHKTT